MSQVTIYVDEELEAKLRTAAMAENLSLSKWVTKLIREKLQSEWPAEVVSLSGAWKEMPLAEEIRAGMGDDLQRESL